MPQSETPAPPAMLDRRLQACVDGGIVERRLGLVTGLLAEGPVALREQALIMGVRSNGVLATYDRGLVLGGFGELITIAPSGAWHRVMLGPEDSVVNILVADLDRDADDDLMVLVERSVVFTEGDEKLSTAMPFAHFVSQEGAREQAPGRFELRSTVALHTEGASFAPLCIADVTGDGMPDVAAIEASQPVVYRGDGKLRFERRIAGALFPDAFRNARCTALLVYDRDGDDDMDILALCADGNVVKPFMHAFDNTGDGHFTLGPRAMLALPEAPLVISELQDLTGDARPDLLLSYTDTNAEPRLALMHGSTGPLKLDAPESVPLDSVTKTRAWSIGAAQVTTMILGK